MNKPAKSRLRNCFGSVLNWRACCHGKLALGKSDGEAKFRSQQNHRRSSGETLLRIVILSLAVELWFGGQAGNRLVAQGQPVYQSYMGLAMETKPSDSGVSISYVVPGSPGEKAGLKEGDLIKAVDGQTVKSSREVSVLFSSHPPYDPDPIKLEIEREGKRFQTQAQPVGYLRLEALTPQKVFFIPSVEQDSPFEVTDPIVGLDSINVLKRILIDPAKGTVEFIGSYDPAYDCGPLPYRQLLEAATRYPNPEFSLDPDRESLKREKELQGKFTADLQKLYGPNGSPSLRLAWFSRWTNLLLAHPLLEVERQIFLDRLADEADLTKSELVKLFNYVNLGGMVWEVPPDILELQIKLLEAEGFHEQAAAYRLYREGTFESLMAAAEKIGKANEAKQLLAEPELASKTDEERRTVLQGFVLFRLARELRILSEPLSVERFSQFRSGSATLQQFDRWFQQFLLPSDDSEGGSLLRRAFSGLLLSNELLNQFYGLQTPMVNLRFTNLDGNNALGRIFYEADYVLKAIDLTEPIFRTIPGHQTLSELLWLERSPTVLTRLAWIPGKVELLASPDSREVVFGGVSIQLETEGETDESDDQPLSAEDQAKAERARERFRAQFDKDYEQYARVYPELHQLREAAKVIAFAKWMSERKLKLAADPGAKPVPGWGTGEKAWVPPKSVPVLYAISLKMVDVTLPDGKRTTNLFFNRLGWRGGVDFRADRKWVAVLPLPPTYEPVASSVTTSAAISQAAVQAALAGDLETARDLAEQSARAMQGELDLKRVPANLKLPSQPISALAAPGSVRLVKEAARLVHSLEASPNSAGGKSQLTANQQALLTSVNNELTRAKAGTPVASDFLYQLQTRQTMRNERIAGLRKLRSGATDPNPAGPKVPSFCEKYRATMGSADDLSPEQKKYFAVQLAELRQQLEKVQQAMANIAKLNRQDLAELEKLERQINESYDQAQERLVDAISLLLIDSPLEILQKRRDEVRGTLNSEMFKSMLARKAASSVDEAAVLDREVFWLLKTKYRQEEIFVRAEGLQKRFDEAKLVYDFKSWSEADKNELDQMKKGIAMLAELAIKDSWFESKIKLNPLTKEAILKWLAVYKAASIGTGFLGDIAAQQLAWDPLMEQLERSISQHRQGLEQLRQKANSLKEQIQCLEAFSGR